MKTTRDSIPEIRRRMNRMSAMAQRGMGRKNFLPPLSFTIGQTEAEGRREDREEEMEGGGMDRGGKGKGEGGREKGQMEGRSEGGEKKGGGGRRQDCVFEIFWLFL